MIVAVILSFRPDTSLARLVISVCLGLIYPLAIIYGIWLFRKQRNVLSSMYDNIASFLIYSGRHNLEDLRKLYRIYFNGQAPPISDVHLKLNWLFMKHLQLEDIPFLDSSCDIPKHLDLEERIWIRKVIQAAKEAKNKDSLDSSGLDDL